jgi:hypothetical protein
VLPRIALRARGCASLHDHPYLLRNPIKYVFISILTAGLQDKKAAVSMRDVYMQQHSGRASSAS